MQPGTIIVTIDGPAGAGKSTAARGLARRLGFEFLDTGAMYRAAGLALTDHGIPFSDETQASIFLNESTLEQRGDQIYFRGENWSHRIRTPEASDAASRVAEESHIRAILVGRQREAARGRNMVCEGRDQGTVVFPDALVKFYVTAAVAVRARRRCEELRAKGIVRSIEETCREIEERDHRDSNRLVGPLRRPDDAVDVHTDQMAENEVIETMREVVERCRRG